jgi:ATP-dependent Lon protease
MLPARNRWDYEDIPEGARNQLEFIWLDRVEESDSRRASTRDGGGAAVTDGPPPPSPRNAGPIFSLA